MPRVHFISGLPRSGSTLLAALLRQNPRFHAAVQSPLADIVGGALRMMSTHESALFVTDAQRQRVLTGLIESYYGHLSTEVVAFDTSRAWTSMLPALAQLLPQARVICCVRNPAWIVDSFERLIQRNALRQSRMFGQDGYNVFSRAEALSKGALGGALCGLRQAWFSEQAARLVGIRYDSLVSRPAKVMAGLYEILGESCFEHDFEHVSYEEEEFDSFLGAPGLHRVSGPIEAKPRSTILPPDIYRKFDEEFWAGSGSNPRQVTIL